MKNEITIMAVTALCILVSVFVFNALIDLRSRGKLNDETSPLGLGWLKAVIFVCSGWHAALISGALRAMTPFIPIEQELFQWLTMLALLLAITFLLMLVNLWLSMMMFAVISKGRKILFEALSSNQGSLIQFSAILLTLSFGTQSALPLIFDKIIPYPNTSLFH
jgi:hypothetical protein